MQDEDVRVLAEPAAEPESSVPPLKTCRNCAREDKIILKHVEIIAAAQERNAELLEQMIHELKHQSEERTLLTNMQKELQCLRENFYETNVLMPLIECLITIADRCRLQVESLHKSLQESADSHDWKSIQAMTQVADARNADRVIAETTLANQGVQTFNASGERFDPSNQKCIRRIKTDDREQHGVIAKRLQPGYRRNAAVLRQEFVSVYVFQKNSDERRSQCLE